MHERARGKKRAHFVCCTIIVFGIKSSGLQSMNNSNSKTSIAVVAAVLLSALRLDAFDNHRAAKIAHLHALRLPSTATMRSAARFARSLCLAARRASDGQRARALLCDFCCCRCNDRYCRHFGGCFASVCLQLSSKFALLVSDDANRCLCRIFARVYNLLTIWQASGRKACRSAQFE